MSFLKNKPLKNYLPVLLIIIIASVLRLLWIDKIPNAIGGDELVYIVTAKSIFLNWTDLSGTWHPLSVFLFHYPLGEAQAELPYFLLAPIVGPASFSLFASRILYAILSILTVLLIYLISKKLFSKNVAIFAGLIAAINPWSIYIGRTNYEVVPAVFFFLLSFYFLLIFKNWKILISIPFLFFAFYSYIGTKLIFLPFVLVCVLYSYFYVNKRKYLKQCLLVFILSLVLVIFFVLSIKNGLPNQRTEEIFLPNNAAISSQVDLLKKTSIQTPFVSFFNNKINAYLGILFTKISNALSFDYLFVNGDNFYNVGYGFFYFIDAFFLLLGLFFALVKKKKESILLLIFIFLGLLPQVFHLSPYGGILESFAPHLALIFPFLIIFIGVGISETTKIIKNKKYYFAALSVISLVYLFFTLSFLYVYFYQFPLKGNFDFHVRVMSNYAKLASQNGESVVLYSPKFRDEFKKYIFYSNSLNNQTAGKIRKIVTTPDKVIFNNIEFAGCNNTIDPSKIKKVVLYDYVCGNLPKEAKHLTIARLSDGGESYRIYNDKLCSKFGLKQFPSGISINDFAIESLSIQKFCKTFITSY